MKTCVGLSPGVCSQGGCRDPGWSGGFRSFVLMFSLL